MNSTPSDIPDSNRGSEPPEPFKCPNCGHPFRIGELICSECGAALVTDGRTHRVTDPEIANKIWATGEVLAPDRKPIIFDIGGARITLPTKEVVMVGRSSPIGGEIPDVDLSAFDAEGMGVSRLHIRIRRKGILLYIADLGSTNGTHLNGRKLIPDGERVLRDGDELYLGRLCIRVRF